MIAWRGCSVGDMTAIAAKAGADGPGDQYWEDVDRYARNYLAEAQIAGAEQVRQFIYKLQ